MFEDILAVNMRMADIEMLSVFDLFVRSMVRPAVIKQHKLTRNYG